MSLRPRRLSLLIVTTLAVSIGTALATSLAAQTISAGKNAVTRIEFVSGTHSWMANIEATPAAREFLAQLPLDLTLKSFGGNEMIADLPRPLTREGAPTAITPRKGDVTFYAPWGNLALFYADGHHSPGLIHLGRIEGDVALLKAAQPLKISIRSVSSSN